MPGRHVSEDQRRERLERGGRWRGRQRALNVLYHFPLPQFWTFIVKYAHSNGFDCHSHPFFYLVWARKEKIQQIFFLFLRWGNEKKTQTSPLAQKHTESFKSALSDASKSIDIPCHWWQFHPAPCSASQRPYCSCLLRTTAMSHLKVQTKHHFLKSIKIKSSVNRRAKCSFRERCGILEN